MPTVSVSFLVLLYLRRRGGPLSTVGLACALLAAKANAVAHMEPGIVPRRSSSVVFSVLSGTSSSEESSKSFSLWLSALSLLSGLFDIISIHTHFKMFCMFDVM